jgi:hypothetical protein
MDFPPHDLLKIAYWKEHYNEKLLPNFLRNTSISKAIKEHHKKWVSDELAACIARPFFDGIDFLHGNDINSGTLFFIPVYETKDCEDGVVVWDYSKRKDLQEKCFKIYEKEYKSKKRNWEKYANHKINIELKHFPADTWTPFASLMAHHAITYLLHTQDEGKIKNWINEIAPKKGEIPELALIFIGVPEIEAYRLKELRRFYKLREDTLNIIKMILEKINIHSIRIGDELVTLIVNYKEKGKPLIEKVLNEIKKSNIKCIIKIFLIPIKKEKSKKRKRPYWVIASNPTIDSYTLGSSLEFGFELEKAEWSKHLMKRNILWICIEPRGNLLECCEEFIMNYAMKIMNKIIEKYNFESINKIKWEFLASPDLMLTITQDYYYFLNDIKSFLGLQSSILIGFSKSLFIKGLHNISEAFNIYERIMEMSKKLHISIKVSTIMTHSKFPFWKVLELMDIYSNKFTIYLRGGLPLSLKPEDFKLMKEIIPKIQGIKSTVWNNEILPISMKSIEEFEFEIERLYSGKNKIELFQKDALLDFIRKLENNHKDESEDIKRRIRYAAFKRLSDFTGKYK